MILLPRARNALQPQGLNAQIDWGHPITDGLLMAIRPFAFVDDVSGAAATSRAPEGQISTILTSAGKGRHSYGTQVFDQYNLPGNLLGRTLPNATHLQVLSNLNAVHGNRAGGISNLSTPLGVWGSTGFLHRIDAFRAYRTDSNGLNILSSSGLDPNVFGNEARRSVVIHRVFAASHELIVNGQVRASGGLSGAISAFDSGSVYRVGTQGDSSSFIANYSLILLWSRSLTNSELQSISDNPWLIYASPRIFVPVSVESGGGATHTNTGSLSADVATIAGTAVHKTLHATSGALASDAAVIAGVASSVTNRPSSGALASDSATIAGTAAHKALHATSGALAAGASSIAGVSAHNIPHATSGALSSGAATIAGSAAKTSAGSFASSGSLSAGDSAISGTATHKALHATSGALSADAATLSGAARIASHRTEGAIAAGPAIMAGVAVHSGPGAVVETQYSGGYVETLREKDARRKRQKRLSDEADNRRQEEQQKPVEPQEKPKKAKRIEVDRRPEQQVSLRDQIAALPVDLDAIYAVQERERLAAEQAAIEAELLAAEQEQQEIMWIASQVQQMIYDAYQGSDRWKAISGKLLRLSQILARR